MGTKTLSELKDNSESFVESNEKSKKNLNNAQNKLNNCNNQVNIAQKSYSQAQIKYNQAVNARNAVANRPRNEDDDIDSISREISMHESIVASAQKEMQEERTRYMMSLQRQKQALLDFQNAQIEWQKATAKLNGLKSEILEKVQDYTSSYQDASILLSLGKGENIQPFMLKLVKNKILAIEALNKVLRSLGEQEIPISNEDNPNNSGENSPKVKRLTRREFGRKIIGSNESKGAYSISGYVNSTNFVDNNDFSSFSNESNTDCLLQKNHNNGKFRLLSNRVKYLDKMYTDAKFALDMPSRKEDWDVVRGRLSSEYKNISDELKLLAEERKSQFNELNKEYNNIFNGPDYAEKSNDLQKMIGAGSDIKKEFEIAISSSKYAETMSRELFEGLDPVNCTLYTGIGGKGFTEIHHSLIQQQGNAVKDFKGTCGNCSIANTLTLLGSATTEEEVVQKARSLKACYDKEVPSFLPEPAKNIIRSKNGGTSIAGRVTILNSFDYDCDNAANQSLSEIARHIENGKGAIINVDHRVLNKQNDVTSIFQIGTDHALTITGVEKDSVGNVIGLWIHDTGVCSNMGNAFYCNAKDYDVWKSNPNCMVQYISKK